MSERSPGAHEGRPDRTDVGRKEGTHAALSLDAAIDAALARLRTRTLRCASEDVWGLEEGRQRDTVENGYCDYPGTEAK